jgi:hypothetical protein
MVDDYRCLYRDKTMKNAKKHLFLIGLYDSCTCSGP